MYERIMIVVEDGQVSSPAIEEGLALAAVHGAEVLFFHVLPSYVITTMDMPPMLGSEPEQFQLAATQAAERILAAAAQLATAAGVAASSASASAADAAECIAGAASSRDSQLIVIGSHGRTALQRLVFGSVVTRLITLAPVPVLVCKQHEPKRLHAAPPDPQERPPQAPDAMPVPPRPEVAGLMRPWPGLRARSAPPGRRTNRPT